MATYPIKMLKDEQNIPFVPLVSTEGIQDPEGLTLEQRLLTKLGPNNLHGGTNISIRTEGYDCYIDLDLPSTLNVIDNLTTSTSGQGALDAHQGYVLKNMIPSVIDDITSTSTTNALSANQGRILNGKIPTVNNTLISTSTTQALSANQGKILKELVDGKVSTSIAVPANADLNTYTTTGFYYCSSNATVNTMSNVPEKYAFSLLVEKHAGVKQTFTTYPTNSCNTYVRNYYNGSWGSWKKILSTTEIADNLTTQSATVALSAQQGYNLDRRLYAIKDYITEVGTSGDWTYVKYSTGRKEAWANITKSLTVNSPEGNMYYGTFGTVNFPNIFNNTPVMTTSCVRSGGYGSYFTAGSISSTQANGWVFADIGVSSAVSVTVSFHLIGT